MTGIIRAILGFLGPLAEKFFGRDTEKARELKARKELEELRAFRDGRISPRFLLFYALVLVFTLFSILVIAGIFFPGIPGLSDTGRLKEILELGAGILP